MSNEQNVAIPNRVESSLRHLKNNNYEEALLNLFPAIDRTAKLRRKKLGSGLRFKKFIADQFDIVSVLGFGSLISSDCKFGGETFQHVLYQLCRNSLVHEGELASNMKIVSGSASIVGGNWELSENIIFGLIIAVITARENKKSKLSVNYQVSFLGEMFSLNSIWGEEEVIKKKIKTIFSKLH
ncbi:MAG: hypothetical protein R3E90_01345 [Marinicella sp.]